MNNRPVEAAVLRRQSHPIIANLPIYPMVASDNYHLPFHLDFKLPFDCQPTFLTCRRSFIQRDYLLLYNTLSNCDWSCVLNENSVHFAVYNFTSSVSEATDETITSAKPKSSTFSHWFSKSLIYNVKKKN
jgi:hypothetical protein